MITQIEIDGFKTFKDFKVELAPFQVIVGANGSGKSNLFDALQLLGRLTSHGLLEAFQDLRGEADDLFTKGFGEEATKSMHFAVEMLLDRKVVDDVGHEVELKYTRLRYELGIVSGVDELGLDGFSINHEALKVIPREGDNWIKKYNVLSEWYSRELANNEPDSGNFITTATNSEEITVINVYRDHNLEQPYLVYPAGMVKNIALRGVLGAEYVSISAVRAEMSSWQFVHLDPEALREISSLKAPRTLSPRGNNLASTLIRMQAEDKFTLGDVSRDMANLVPGIRKIRVERDKIGDRFVIYADTTDQRVFSSQVLSDGTLRLLALATLKNDPQLHGILCLEEPENGVSPLHLERMARLLRKMATDLSDPKQAKVPLCQVLLTTHSPLFISQPDVLDALLLAIVPTRVQGKANPVRVTIMAPAITSEVLSHLENVSRDDKAVGAYTANMLKSYLGSELLEEARERLEKGHSELNER